MSGACVTVNAPHVIHETIDGEVIVINLATGTYYSLKDSAAELWQLIDQPRGAHEEELVEALSAHYEMSVEMLEAALEPFLRELATEGLVSVAHSVPTAAPLSSNERPSPNGNSPKHAFTPPLLEKFTDMQDLVLLDPVHEVDATGWPQRPDATSGVAGV